MHYIYKKVNINVKKQSKMSIDNKKIKVLEHFFYDSVMFSFILF